MSLVHASQRIGDAHAQNTARRLGLSNAQAERLQTIQNQTMLGSVMTGVMQFLVLLTVPFSKETTFDNALDKGRQWANTVSAGHLASALAQDPLLHRHADAIRSDFNRGFGGDPIAARAEARERGNFRTTNIPGHFSPRQAENAYRRQHGPAKEGYTYAATQGYVGTQAMDRAYQQAREAGFGHDRGAGRWHGHNYGHSHNNHSNRGHSGGFEITLNLPRDVNLGEGWNLRLPRNLNKGGPLEFTKRF